MTPATIAAGTADLAALRRAVDTTLEDFLEHKAQTIAHPCLLPLIGQLRDFLAAGGKRIRPLLCCCGWYAAGGTGETGPMLRAAAALELFHAFALIHDDVMDDSDTRRGRPTVHRSLTTQYLDRRDQRDAGRFGVSGAILLGDLALVWSDELLHTGGLPRGRQRAARPVLEAMRTEVMIGQYLDLLATGFLSADVDATLAVIRYKTAKYTVERPLQLGAALAGADREQLAACTAFGLPIGEAFQLRDDVLGIFGDPTVTGKSRLDDLRDGKCTTLVALALREADPAQDARLRALVGDPQLDEHGAAEARGLLVATGALTAVEEMIADRLRTGLEVLEQSPLDPAGTTALRQLAEQATRRTS
ncbi:polyprenyl synthetase family protein [Streptomyces sp. NPDC002730]|uniref:polyprenyl synthetase family protein n=1 Tax=Streptomyces sp. NPDC002730 TaxID=3364662 RepID=UPI0036B59AE4